MQKTLSLLNLLKPPKSNPGGSGSGSGSSSSNMKRGSTSKKVITLIHDPAHNSSSKAEAEARLCYFQTPTSRVYLEYPLDLEGLPPPTAVSGNSVSTDSASTPPASPQPEPHPKKHHTRFICTSDTHARTFPIPPGDVLLHAGDLTNTGSLKDWEKTLEWLCAAECGVKIIIAGNHDVTLDEEWYDMNWTRFHKGIGRQDRTKILSLLTSPRAKAAGLVYLQDESFKFRVRPGGKEWVVYGSPWSPEFHDWAFGYPRDETAVKIAKRIPKCDILLTHSPPFSILDKTLSGEQVGCEALLERIKELRPRLSLFGHIHEGRGGEVWGWGGGASGGGKEGGELEKAKGEGDGEVVWKLTEDDFEEIKEVQSKPEIDRNAQSGVLLGTLHSESNPSPSPIPNPGPIPDPAPIPDPSPIPDPNPIPDPRPVPHPHSSSNPTSQPKLKTLTAHSPTPTGDSDVPDNYTIFINAASWPAGPRTARARQASKSQNQGGGMPRSHFGGLGFQPVIIDLLDVDDSVESHVARL